jgi:hypothetical protein
MEGDSSACAVDGWKNLLRKSFKNCFVQKNAESKNTKNSVFIDGHS